MQYGFSIKRKCYLLSVLLMTVWLTGCVQEEFESTPSPAGNGIRFTLTVPDVNLPSVSSRTMTGTGTAKKEDEIETVDILVFDMSKTPAVFLEWVSATISRRSRGTRGGISSGWRRLSGGKRNIGENKRKIPPKTKEPCRSITRCKALLYGATGRTHPITVPF